MADKLKSIVIKMTVNVRDDIINDPRLYQLLDKGELYGLIKPKTSTLHGMCNIKVDDVVGTVLDCTSVSCGIEVTILPDGPLGHQLNSLDNAEPFGTFNLMDSSPFNVAGFYLT